ncbi:MAG: hypothetical protein A2131_01000 [Candidatus Sungbacteria bacterium GWC2_49_10]|uniref:Uncharacterized protein n=2 Tax=Parcubacteria group TaxID=1794811 RepID=A0A0G1WM06_9BACT|nr:MAG: hypothetical protein UY61_C0049G0013 [Candidatus Adlerbacteria bacterium GW2011_GWC1_50_9]OGZ94218.1 MAG: hypothetical protein A2131_01000 [Candidatus Sungbacteria bacterium GWC2_49_10]
MTLEEAHAGGLKEKVAYIIEALGKRPFNSILPGSLIDPREVHYQLHDLFRVTPTDKDLLLAFVANVPQLLAIEIRILNSPFSGSPFTGFLFRKI